MGAGADRAGLPFEGLPAWSQVLFYVAFVLIVVMLIWTIALFVASRRSLLARPSPTPRRPTASSGSSSCRLSTRR